MHTDEELKQLNKQLFEINHRQYQTNGRLTRSNPD